MEHYRKHYLCICSGHQEKMYLEHVAALIKDFPRKAVKFNVYIDRPYRLTKTYENYDSAALFDYDFENVEFERNIEICDRLNKEYTSASKKKGRQIFHAYSSVNFDLWLILHKEEFTRGVSSNDAYIADVRKIFGLKATDDIKNEGTMRKILNEITLRDVKTAIKRAESIRSSKVKKDGFIVGNSTVYSNPDFSIHAFMKHVLKHSKDL